MRQRIPPGTGGADDIGPFIDTNTDTRIFSRREALTLALAATAGTLIRPVHLFAREQSGTTAARGSSLVIRNARPLDAEAPIEALRTFETRNDLFFVRSHHIPPTAPATSWTLAIDGDVARPLTLTLDDLRRMRAERRAVTLECAGNGRGRLTLPATSGVQWQFGAVSTATWTGVPLSTLLEQAGVQASALHFWMEAADQSPVPGAPKFLRSIPRDIAIGEALVAYEMNGQPLPAVHGGPLRLVVPRWYGMSSTKWLTHIHARATESDNHFMARGYRYADGSPVDLMRVKSVITTPRDGGRLAVGKTRVGGVAWTGTGTIAKVELSIDEGKTWQEARFTTEPKPGVWRLWEADIALPSSGAQRVRARATDTDGHTQSDQATPNPGGYGNNAIHEVRIDAR
jgi:DMSO/TMAO reductase YedYZ molybdopterin-dependent catalytic subunit